MPGTTRGLAGTGTTSRTSTIGIRPEPRRVRRTQSLKSRFGLTASEIYDRGLSACEAEAKLDRLTQFGLQAGRVMADLLVQWDYDQYEDPDTEYEAEQDYMQGRRPRLPRPLRDGARMPGAKVRDTI